MTAMTRAEAEGANKVDGEFFLVSCIVTVFHNVEIDIDLKNGLNFLSIDRKSFHYFICHGQSIEPTNY